jgi:hypothetical protein
MKVSTLINKKHRRKSKTLSEIGNEDYGIELIVI